MKFEEWWERQEYACTRRECMDIAADAWNAAVRLYANDALLPIVQLAQAYLADLEKMNRSKGGDDPRT